MIELSSFTPPSGIRMVEMRDQKRNKSYSLAFSDAHSDYEEYIGQLGGPDENASFLSQLLNGGGTLFDVGANIGTIAVPVSASGAAVVAIEMNPSNCLKLWICERVNRLENFHVVQAAASDRDGIIAFQGVEAWGSVGDGTIGTPAVCLKIDTLFPIFSRLPKPFVLKIDVEGHEASVLSGCLETLRNIRPVVLFECIEIEGAPNYAAREAKQVLERVGYDLFLMRHGVLCPKTSMDIQEGHVTDFLAVPAGLHSALGRAAGNIRQFTDQERIDWVREMAIFPMCNHQRHAAGVLMRWSRENPGLASLAAPSILSSLLALDHLSDLHSALRNLR